ncbi:MAG: citronellyl-CoA synthetase, partial [Bacteroidia bacterium]
MSLGNVVSTLWESRILTTLKRELEPRPLTTCDSLAARMEATAARHPGAEAIVFEGQSLTWSQMNQAVNRVAAVLNARGLTTGDTVCLMMENRIEFATCLLALNKLGVIAALINTNLTSKSLAHCIAITHSRFCIFGEERFGAIDEIRTHPDLAPIEGYLFVADEAAQASPDWAIDLGAEAAQATTQNPPQTTTQTLADTALYLYTSGTTGFPKASVLSNRRLLASATMGHIGGLKATVKDRIYLCLPLYHGTGLFFGLATACCSGATLILRRKFSGSHFLNDVREHRATCFVYI